MRKLFVLFCWIPLLLSFSGFAQPLSPYSPANQLVSTQIPNLQWNVFAGAIGYQVEISTTPAFTFSTSYNATQAQLVFPSGVPENTRIWWRVRAETSPGVYTQYGNASTFTLVNANTLPGALMWISGLAVSQANNTAIASLTNQINIPLTIDQSVVNRRPTYFAQGGLNNKPYIRFNAAQVLRTNINGAYIATNDSVTYYFLGKNETQTQNFGYIFYYGNFDEATPNFACRGLMSYNGVGDILFLGYTGTVYRYQPFISALQYGMYVAKDNIDSAKLYRNGIVMGASSSGLIPTTGGSGATIGGSYNASTAAAYRGNIHEIMVFKKAHDDVTRNMVETMLQHRYIAPVNLGKDTVRSSFCTSVTLNAGTGYSSYLWSTGQTTQSITYSGSGKVWVRTTDVFGKVSSDTVQVGLPIPFNQPPRNVVLCAGSNYVWNTNYPNGAGFSFLWNTGATTNSITITQPGAYRVRITDGNGCSFFSDSVIVSVDSLPLNTLGPNVTICNGNTVRLQRPLSQATHQFLWSDGTTNTFITPSITNAYSVAVSNSNGCQLNDTIQVTLSGIAPIVGFAVDKRCVGSPVQFFEQTITNDTPTGFRWNFGDGFIDSVANPSHSFIFPGIYQVRLEVTTSSGCVNDTILPIAISSLPVANFSNTGSCERVPIVFTDISQPGDNVLSDWFWDFGEPVTGDTSRIQNPTYTYANSGTFEVQLIAVNASGCADTIRQLISITESPVAQFSYNKSCWLDPIQFTNTSTMSAPYVITGYRWNFGNGDTSILINPRYTYQNQGTFPVQLRVNANNGCYALQYDTLLIDKFVDAQVTLPQDTICRDVPYLYLDASTAQNTAINTWKWTFDNNGVVSTQNPSFAFTESGKQNITLLVTSADNCIDSVKTSVFVKNPPVANFTLGQQIGVPPFEVTPQNTSTGNPTSYTWYFTNTGDSSTSVSPSYIYADTGNYTLVLNVTDAYGCSNQTSKPIVVVNPSYGLFFNDVSCSLEDGYLSFDASVINTSNVALSGIDFYARGNYGSTLNERWEGALNQGQQLNYTFNGKLEVPPGTIPAFCCVEIKTLFSPVDTIGYLLKKCFPLQDGFTILPPFPNPTVDELSFSMVLPFADDLNVEVFDVYGHPISAYDWQGSVGVNAFKLPVYNLRFGMYMVRITYRDQVRTFRFIKQ